MVNHILPSGPWAISDVGCGIPFPKASATPSAVIRPTFDPAKSVNHMFPEGPAAMRNGCVIGTPKVTVVPSRATLEIEPEPWFVTHRLPEASAATSVAATPVEKLVVSPGAADAAGASATMLPAPKATLAASATTFLLTRVSRTLIGPCLPPLIRPAPRSPRTSDILGYYYPYSHVTSSHVTSSHVMKRARLPELPRRRFRHIDGPGCSPGPQCCCDRVTGCVPGLSPRRPRKATQPQGCTSP